MAAPRSPSGPSARFAAWLAALSVLFVVAPGLAASAKLQAVGEASIGVTDNAQSAPDVPLPGGAEKSAGAFLVLRPGLVLGVLSAQAIQRLAYTFDYNVYFARAASSSSSNRLEYRGVFDISPRVNAILGASATESDSYAALTLAPPASGVLPLLPGGDSKMLQLGADEVVDVELAVGWRSWEGVGVSLGMPLFDTDAPRTITPNARVGIEYSWIGDALGAEGRGSYFVVRDGVRADGTRVRLARELQLGGVAFYRHDIGRSLTSSVEGGAVRVTRFATDTSRWYPLAGAMLAYSEVFGDAQLAYAHAVTTNVLFGQSLVSDEIRLRGAIPLDKKGIFTVAASAGYQRGRLLDENARLATRVSVFLADATFGWQLNPWLLLGVRAQHIDQRSDVRVVTLPVSFVQNNLMLGASFAFPPDPEVASTYRAPKRVDRTDELRGASETTVESIPAPSGRAR
jgi:hypothetical protein